MSTIPPIAAAAMVVLAALCAVAGYLLGTNRMAVLRTVLATATHAASHDRLTGLPNRSQLTARLMALADARQPMVLAIVNLDRFVEANQFGHRVGDQLLVMQAAQLRHTASRQGGSVYRLAGDEFAAVLPTPSESATVLAAELLAAIAEPVELLIRDHLVLIHPTATAGVACFDPADAQASGGDPISRLLTRANTALQHGKRTARGTAILWQKHLPELPRPRRDSRPCHPESRQPMSTPKLTHLDHLLAVFGTHQGIEQLEEELRIVAGHHSELADYVRAQLAAGAYDHPSSLITAGGAVQLAERHDASAANSTAMADIIHTALNPDLDSDLESDIDLENQ